MLKFTETARNNFNDTILKNGANCISLSLQQQQEGYVVDLDIAIKDDAKDIDGVLVSCSDEDLELLKGVIFDIKDGQISMESACSGCCGDCGDSNC